MSPDSLPLELGFTKEERKKKEVEMLATDKFLTYLISSLDCCSGSVSKAQSSQ